MSGSPRDGAQGSGPRLCRPSVVHVGPGSVVDRRYRVVREIARGGMGIVLEVEHVRTGRRAALKLLAGRALGSEAAHQRLLREARALGRVRHPHVVEVLDAGVCDEAGPFVALESLEGRTLESLLAARQRLPLPDALRVLRQLLEALCAVHGRGIVHRDLKPGNVLVCRDAAGVETIKLIDFGLVALADEPDEEPVGPKITRAGELLGTVEYMAPEQLLARPDVDARADLYAAAVTAYECLSGAVPFGGEYAAVLVRVLQNERPTPLRATRPELPAAVEEVILRGLAVDRDARWPSARAMLDALLNAVGTTLGPSVARGCSSLLLHYAGAPGMAQPTGALGASEPRADAGLADAAAHEGLQRRRDPRVPFTAPVVLVREDGRRLEANAEDLSAGGMLVIGSETLSVGERIRVRFALPGVDPPVDTRATVRWARVARRHCAAGLAFDALEKTVRDAIASYVGARAAGP
ncbi:MAG: serine/threonine-protein kinase [Myxococcota bacterium]|nr:serine/threonine-protein kinase [Myxococcota bacterium]MDW8362547.1 serine/threonine-protein kinase [Myxococcales bacterium]